MASSPLLTRELRALFGFIRGLMLFWLVVLPLLFVCDWHPANHWTPGLGAVQFRPDTLALRVNSAPDAKPVEGLKISELNGALVVADRAEGAQLLAATRVPVFVARMARSLILFVIAHLLWRLCQAVERGEIFSAGNFSLVRWLGIALTLRPVIGLITETWQRAAVARFVEDHVWFDELRTIASSSELGWWERSIEALARHGDFDFSFFVTGLFVLVLAEVFRRGLALKQENDLTV